MATTEAIGLYARSLSYGDTNANTASAITVSYTNTVDMAQDDYVEVVLDGFTGTDKVTATIELSHLSGNTDYKYHSCLWTLSTKTFRLVLNTGIPVSARTAHSRTQTRAYLACLLGCLVESRTLPLFRPTGWHGTNCHRHDRCWHQAPKVRLGIQPGDADDGFHRCRCG